MSNCILTMAKWEFYRLKLRFSGRSRFVVLAIVLLAIITSYLVYHQGMVVGKELYTVGVSPESPAITDPRFKVVRLDRDSSRTLLSQRVIDVYLDGKTIISRSDERSQYVSGTLRKHLARQELFSIARRYDLNRAFPLRVEVVTLETPESHLTAGTEPPPAPVAEPEGPSSTSEPAPSPGPPAAGSPTAEINDAEVRQQLDVFESGGLLKVKEALLSKPDVIVPSLTPMPLPLAQVTLVFSYVLPLLLSGVFFASSITEERVNRKLTVLLSAPVSKLQVILGKMFPYLVYSWLAVAVITLIMGGKVWLSLAIFTPVTLLILATYMMVALTYRTFKDLTFFTILVLTAIMAYLVVPALLTGVSDLSYISPLTLAVEMYRGEAVAAKEYFLATAPLYLIFCQALFVGTRLFNEEFLTGFKPMHVKMAEALNFAIDVNHLNLSAFLSSLFLLPLAFTIELLAIVFVHNLSLPLALWILIIISVTIEELAKSVIILVLLKNGAIRGKIETVKLSALSAVGFFSGEKLLLFLALAVLSPSAFTAAVFGAGLLIMPLVLHVVSTCVVGLLTTRLGAKYYPLAIIIGSVIHAAYNLYVIGTLGMP